MRPKSDSLIGRTLDNYTINRLIAKGGMGRVYEAIEKGSNRKIALKVLMLDEDRASEIMERFQREAQSLGRLESHPNIVTIYRYGEVEGIHYIAMQLVEGISLAEYYSDLKNKGKFMEFGELLHIAKQVVNALDYAHERGVIHRDIKPGNIMLEEDAKTGQKRAILMDFGLVMQLDTQTTAGVPTLGLAFGTPRYIAPEQAISSQQASPQSDIYALGVVIFELLAGRPPFDDSDTPMSVALSHINKKPPSPRDFRAEVPERVARVILKALEKDPKDRYQTAYDFYNALEDAFQRANDSVPTAERRNMKPAESAIPAPQPTPHFRSTPKRPKNTSGRGRLAMIGLVALLVIGAIIGAIFVFSGGDDGETTEANNGDTDNGSNGASEGDNIIELYYSGNTLSIRNPTNRAMNYANVELRGDGQKFELNQFGTSQVGNWSPRKCGYVKLTNDDLNRASNCSESNEFAPIEFVNDAKFVWTKRDSFEVYIGNRQLQECSVSNGRCEIRWR